MFQVGDTIVCDHNGVCKIVEIGEIPMLKKGVLYYTMEPIYSKGARIFVPVDTEKLVMRHVISEGETKRLMDDIPNIEAIWIPNEKLREEQYKEVARQYDPHEWVKIIKTIHQRKLNRRMEGKKITYVDDKYMKMAEDNLYGELCIPLKLSRAEAEKFICEKMGRS